MCRIDSVLYVYRKAESLCVFLENNLAMFLESVYFMHVIELLTNTMYDRVNYFVKIINVIRSSWNNVNVPSTNHRAYNV